MKKLVVISDWAGDQLYCQEMRSVVEGYLHIPHAHITYIPCTSNSIHASYLLNQFVDIEERYARPLETVVYVQSDPRIESSNYTSPSKGAELIIIRLVSGMIICGPNAKNTFSMIYDKIDTVFSYSTLQTDKHISPDEHISHARIVALIMEAKEDEMEMIEIHKNTIPRLSDYYIGHVDIHGNIKTTIPHEFIKSKYKEHQYIPVTIDGIKKQLLYISNMFHHSVKEPVIYASSSGNTYNPFMDIGVWIDTEKKNWDTACSVFNHPTPGTVIQIST